jgi:hypothetical protein
MEPVNHWQPVTTEYQRELPAIHPERAQFGQKTGWTAERRSNSDAPAELPIGITCVAWFYVLAAGFYFVFGSVLLSYPSSDFAAQLIGYFRIVLPLPVGVADGVPLDNLLAEAFFVMAMASASVGVMWMVRFRPVRWVTLCYAGGSLMRCAYYFLYNQGAAALTLRQTQVWLALSAIDALIFCYVAFYAGIERVFDE